MGKKGWRVRETDLDDDEPPLLDAEADAGLGLDVPPAMTLATSAVANVEMLKFELDRRGLVKSGNKADLKARLEQAIIICLAMDLLGIE